jgi:hypothetical protein
MKTLFHLAFICLIISACQKETSFTSELTYDTKQRTSLPLRATLVLANNNTVEYDVLKAKCTSVNDDVLAVTLFSTLSDSTSYSCKSLKLKELNSLLRLTTISPSGQYEYKTECLATPNSTTRFKLVIQPGNTTVYQSSFIGEEQDGL